MNDSVANDLRSPKVLATFRHPLEAEHLANGLRSHGIEVLTTGTTIATGAIEFAQVDVEVLVTSEQFDAARSIMNEIQSNEPIDWDNVNWQTNEIESSSNDQMETNTAEAETSEDSIESTISRWFYPSSPSKVSKWFLFAMLVLFIGYLVLVFFSPS